MTINWLALIQVAIATIVVAVTIGSLMSFANRMLMAGEGKEGQTASFGNRLAGYATIGLIGAIIAAGLYLLVHKHIANLFGLN